MQVHGYYRKLQENWPCQSIPGHVYMLKTLLVHNIRQQIWQWNFSRVANIKMILYVIGQTLKKCWFLCCYRPNPPKKNCHSEGIFFFSKTLAGSTCLSSKSSRVLVNSKFGVFYSNFLSLTLTFCKVSTEKYSKTPTFSGRQHFYSYFQNPSENSVQWYRQCCIDFHLKYSSFTMDSILDCTIYSKRSIKIWSGLKKKKKKELPTYSFWNWCVGA